MLTCHTALVLALGREARPPDTAWVDDPVTGARCHVQKEDWLPRCDVVFEALGEAWTAQVDDWGWPAPLPDGGVGGSEGLDIYFSAIADGGAYVSSSYVDADPEDGQQGASSWMVLDPAISDDELAAYLSHEFNHVLQFVVDFSEPTLPIWEGTATWAEELTYPGLGSGPTVIPDYQAEPWAGLLRDGWWLWDEYAIWSWYEYGSVLWLMHLDEVYGIDPLTLWQAMRNPKPRNEPDLLDAYEALTGDARGAFADFAVWRTEQAWPVAVAGSVGVGDRFTPELPPHDWGMVYVSLEEPGEPVLEGDPAVDWQLVQVSDELVAVLNLGAPDFDGDDSSQAASFTLRLDPPEGGVDSDPAVSEEPPGGCGCGGGAALAGWPLGLALLALGGRREKRRRRRHRGAASPLS